MKKIDLIKDRCIGCGACMSIAPENFTFGDDGRAEMINNEATNEAIEASETCPVSAIVINCHECKENCEDEKVEICNCHEGCTCGEDCNCSDNCTCNE